MPKELVAYNRESAVAYAHRWAYSRNPAFYNFDTLGGDCTNYVSQCILAGAHVMNYDLTYGWYYINANRKSPSWSGVPFLKNFLVRRTDGPGPLAIETTASGIIPADVIQLSFDGKSFQHSLFVVAVGTPSADEPSADVIPNEDNILVATHTDDSDYRTLSSYLYKNIRFLHITDVRQ